MWQLRQFFSCLRCGTFHNLFSSTSTSWTMGYLTTLCCLYAEYLFCEVKGNRRCWSEGDAGDAILRSSGRKTNLWVNLREIRGFRNVWYKLEGQYFLMYSKVRKEYFCEVPVQGLSETSMKLKTVQSPGKLCKHSVGYNGSIHKKLL